MRRWGKRSSRPQGNGRHPCSAFFVVLMIASPIAAYILNAHILRKDNAIYWIEFCGVWAFAAYWIVKGIEMSGPDTEKKTCSNQVQNSVTSSFSPVFPSRSTVIGGPPDFSWTNIG